MSACNYESNAHLVSGISILQYLLWQCKFWFLSIRSRYPLVSQAASSPTYKHRSQTASGRRLCVWGRGRGWGGRDWGCFLECNRDEGTLVLHSLISDSVCRRRHRRRRRMAVVGRSSVGWMVGGCSRSIMLSHPPPARRPEELGEYMARLTHYERFVDRTLSAAGSLEFLEMPLLDV